MADPLVYNSVVRFTVHGTYAGQDVANVWDIRVIPAGSHTRHEAIADVAKHLVDGWWLTLDTDPINTGYVATLLSWVDMNAIDGETGSTLTGNAHSFPKSGDSEGLRMPGNVSYKVRKTIDGTRGKRSGSAFIAGVNEEATVNGAPNMVTAAYVTLLQTAMNGWRESLDGESSVCTRFPVVCHTKLDGLPPHPVANGFSNMGPLIVEDRLSSQRRRLGRR